MANTTLKSTVAPFWEFHERNIVAVLCVFAAIHVFIFSAGFPFFNNVDEGMHFDLVLKYAHGEVPGQIELISTNAGIYLGLMSSHEFYERADQFPGGQYPAPLWTIPTEKMHSLWAARSEIWQAEYNYEVSQAPLYYAVGALWWHIGEWLGLQGGRLVYWLRFLNMVLISGLVWLAYATAWLLFPANAPAETVPDLSCSHALTFLSPIGRSCHSGVSAAKCLLFDWKRFDVGRVFWNDVLSPHPMATLGKPVRWLGHRVGTGLCGHLPFQSDESPVIGDHDQRRAF